MKKIENWNEVKEAGNYKVLPAGPQICRITGAVDYIDKEYLEILFEIVDGEYKGYFTELSKAFPDNRWGGRAIRSYKAKALSFFKSFTTAVEKSNPGYKWDFDEKKLIGKFVVVNFGEEEWETPEGELKVLVKAQEFRSLVAFREGKIKTLDIKKLKKVEKKDKDPFADLNNDFNISNDDLPF